MFGIYVVFVQMFFTQHPLLAVQTGPKAVKWHHALHSLVRLQMSCCFIIHLPYIIFLSALFALCHGVVVSLSHSETESKSWPCGFRSPGPGLLLLLGQTGHEFSYVFVHFPNRFSMNVPVSTRFCPWFSRRISVWVAAVPPTSSRKPWNWSSAVTPPWTPWVRCRRTLRSAWVPAAWRSTRGTATAATGTPLHRMPSHSVTVATSSAATAPVETFQSEDLRWDRTVSESDGDSRRVRVIVDDLAMAPKSNTGVRPVLEFLRQFLETGLGSAQEHWECGSLTCPACWSLQTSHNDYANGGWTSIMPWFPQLKWTYKHNHHNPWLWHLWVIIEVSFWYNPGPPLPYFCQTVRSPKQM